MANKSNYFPRRSSHFKNYKVILSGRGSQESNKKSEFIKELGIPTTLREVGTTEDMLPKIANSSVILDGGYKKLTPDEILTILKEAY